MIHTHTQTDSVIILDFETTGLSPQKGDRCIEVGAVRLHQGQVQEHFQRLMHPGRRVSRFIEAYTGISNAMLAEAEPCEQVFAELAEFLGDDPIVAHNASFDRRFLEAEFARLNHQPRNPWGCSMKLARRVIPEAPKHGLGPLVDFCQIPVQGRFHRALADAQMTTSLWLLMLERLQQRHSELNISFELLQALSATPKTKVAAFLQQHAAAQRQTQSQRS